MPPHIFASWAEPSVNVTRTSMYQEPPRTAPFGGGSGTIWTVDTSSRVRLTSAAAASVIARQRCVL